MYGIFEVIPDFQVTSSWYNSYCASDGFLRQQRSALQIVKPSCDKRVKIWQYQDIAEQFCAVCPAPVVVSDWHVRQCIGEKTVYQRDLMVKVFDPEVTDCSAIEPELWSEMKVEDLGECKDSIVIPISVPPLSDDTGNAGKPIVLVLSAGAVVLAAVSGLLVYFFFIRKKNKKKKRKGIYLFFGVIIILLLIGSILPQLPFSIYNQPYVNNAVVTPTKPFSAYIPWFQESQPPMRIRLEGSALESSIWKGVGGETAIIPYSTFVSLEKTEKQILIVEHCSLYNNLNCDMTVPEYQSWCFKNCRPPTGTMVTTCQQLCNNYQIPAWKTNPYLWVQTEIIVPARRQTVGSFEAWIDSSACVLTPNVVVVAETFSAGQTLTMQNFRYNVKAFCSQTPILVTEAGEVVGQRLEEYSILRQSYVTIPAGQTWTFFYITDVTSEMPYVCKKETYNPVTETCQALPGILWSCSQGSFDPIEGLCVVQPEIRYACDIGYFNTERQKCIYQCPDPLNCFCPAGSNIEVDETGIKRCVFDADFSKICGMGTYNSESHMCEYLAQPVPVTDIWATINGLWNVVWSFLVNLFYW